MAERQFQIPGGEYINATDDGREYQIPGYNYFNAETAAASFIRSPRGLDAGMHETKGGMQ